VCSTQGALDYHVSAFILTFPSTCVLEVASYKHKTLVPCYWKQRRECANKWEHTRTSCMCQTG